MTLSENTRQINILLYQRSKIKGQKGFYPIQGYEKLADDLFKAIDKKGKKSRYKK